MAQALYKLPNLVLFIAFLQQIQELLIFVGFEGSPEEPQELFIYWFEQEFDVDGLKATKKISRVCVLVHVEDMQSLALELRQLLDGAGLACAGLSDQEQRLLPLQSHTDLLHETESCGSVDEALVWLALFKLSGNRLASSEVKRVVADAVLSSMSHRVVEEGIGCKLRLPHVCEERIGCCCQSEQKRRSDILVVNMCKIYVCDLKKQVL